MQIQIKERTQIILIPVPKRNPINAPIAALKTPSQLPLLFISSPIKAPTNGPAIIPMGPIKNPTISPIVEPVIAFLLPPNFLVINIGVKLSKIETAIAKKHVINKQIKEMLLYEEK